MLVQWPGVQKNTVGLALGEEFNLEQFQQDFESRANDNKKKLKEVDDKMKELQTLMETLESQKSEIENIEQEIGKLASEMENEAQNNAAGEDHKDS